MYIAAFRVNCMHIHAIFLNTTQVLSYHDYMYGAANIVTKYLGYFTVKSRQGILITYILEVI